MSFFGSLQLPVTPAKGDLLPWWLILTSAAGIYNMIQAHLQVWQTKEIYSKKADEITPLASRIFGYYTGMVSIARLIAAYNLTSPACYNLGMSAYLMSLSHFALETLVFGSVKFNRASAAPMIVSTSGLAWMLLQKKYYLGL